MKPNHENLESETVLKRKTPGRPKEEKPLIEFGDTMIREKTKPILTYLTDKCSELKVPFDILVAKVSMQYFYTTGENYNESKGNMFNEVVTLMKFSA